MTNQQLINQIKDRMASKGITQQMLADTISSDQAYVSKFLNGKIDPKLSTVLKIVDAAELKIEINYLDTRKK